MFYFQSHKMYLKKCGVTVSFLSNCSIIESVIKDLHLLVSVSWILGSWQLHTDQKSDFNEKN